VPWSGPARDERGAEKFHGRVRDAQGLSNVQYWFTYSRIEAPGVVRSRAGMAALALHLTPADAAHPLAAFPYLIRVGRRVGPSEDEHKPETVDLATFVEEMRKRQRDDLTRAELLRRLAQPARGRAGYSRVESVDPDKKIFML